MWSSLKLDSSSRYCAAASSYPSCSSSKSTPDRDRHRELPHVLRCLCVMTSCFIADSRLSWCGCRVVGLDPCAESLVGCAFPSPPIPTVIEKSRFLRTNPPDFGTSCCTNSPAPIDLQICSSIQHGGYKCPHAREGHGQPGGSVRDVVRFQRVLQRQQQDGGAHVVLPLHVRFPAGNILHVCARKCAHVSR